MEQIVYVASPESKQIHVWRMDNNGYLKLIQVIQTPGNGQPIAIHPTKTHLYIGIRPNLGIVNYQINELGFLIENNVAPLLGGGPTHMTINNQGNVIYSASYSGNCLNISPINNKRLVEAPIQILKGLMGCHSANIDYDHQILWVPCLKENCIRLYSIKDQGLLITTKLKISNLTNTGPRHMVFHHNGLYAYIINEIKSTIDVIIINYDNFGPQIIQTLDIIPKHLNNNRWASDIHITPDGRWLYCCDRAANIISCFAVSKKGDKLNFVNYTITEKQPRGFNIEAHGNYVIVAGQKSNHIAVYNINKQTGSLILLNRYAVGLGPMWISIL